MLSNVQDWKMQIYWRLPVCLQETALTAYATYLHRLYYGSGYVEWYEQFKKWENQPEDEFKTWQDDRLRVLVRLVATRTQYYRNAWRNIDWQSVRSTADLSMLPRLDKQEIRQNETKFVVEGVNWRRLWLEKTSGTTGTSLRIYWPKEMLPKWWALVEVAIRNVTGVSQDIPRATMGGRPVVPGNTVTPPYWRFNRRWHQLYLSSYHVSPASAASYVDAIKRYGCQWITGYGSVIAALAESALAMNLPSVKLKAAVVSGDTLFVGMRESIEKFFNCKCFNSYGNCEGVCMAMECSEGRMHIIPAAGIWEILREDGSRCEPGEVGEIVGTTLLNDAMPLIRYRLGDYAAWAINQNCSCGNRNPIITDLEGRVDDYLVTLDGRRIGRLSTAVKRSPSIHSAQIVQDRPGHAYLLVRPGDGYRESHGAAVRDDIIERIGSFDVEVVEVRDIPKTPQGKTKLVVRLIDSPQLQDDYGKLLGERRFTRCSKTTYRDRLQSFE